MKINVCVGHVLEKRHPAGFEKLKLTVLGPDA